MQIQKIAWTVSIGMLCAIHGEAQAGHVSTAPPQVSQGSPQLRPDPVIIGSGDEARERLAKEMAKKANLERQAALKADSDRLLKLAQELKDSVNKSNENILSLEVLKKAEEIEKLAKSVKEKMKGPN